MKPEGPFLAALDYGTGGGKCAIFDAGGRRLSVVREPWTYQVVPYEHDSLTRGTAFDPHAFWTALARCSRQAIEQAQIDPSGIQGVAATAQRLGTVFLDARGREIYAAPNMDGRGLEGGFEVLGAIERDRAVRITGHWPPFVSSLARLLRFRKLADQPKVAYVLTLNDWITYRLSGVLAAEPSNAAESMLLDVSSRLWSDELLELFAIERRLLPPVVEPGTPLGKVGEEAAQHTGFAAGTPVFAGGADTQCAMLGAGVVEPGQGAAVLGTTTPVMIVTARPEFDAAGRLWTGCHVLPDRWTLESNSGDTGIAFEWLLALLGLEGEDAYQTAESLIAAAAPEAEAVATFAGPQIFDLQNYDPNRATSFFFRSTHFASRPTRGDLLLGFLSNVACAVRANLEQVEEVRGAPAGSVTLSGGMTRLPSLLGRFARISRRPVLISDEPHATALGAALLAGVGRRVHADVATAVREMVRRRPLEIEGKEALNEKGEAEYARWRRLYPEAQKLVV
jgi:autoinducer 2 (AI-2) kinase